MWIPHIYYFVRPTLSLSTSFFISLNCTKNVKNENAKDPLPRDEWIMVNLQGKFKSTKTDE